MNAVPGHVVEAELGRGRSSVVYLAREGARGRKVALKLARRTRVDFSREVAAAGAMEHLNVLQVFGHGVAGDDAFLSMEVAAGGSLALQRVPLAAAQAASLVCQAAAALDALHRRGWVHRDVKPANLLLRGDGSLALADFGCAVRRGESGPEPRGTVVGTPLYAAPEQSDGAAAQPAADIYSLGVVFYELLVGQPPFPGQTPTELFCQHLLAPVPKLPPEHGCWQPLLAAMLAKDPRERPADGHAVLAYLQRFETEALP